MYLKQKCSCGAEFEVDDNGVTIIDLFLASKKMNEWEEKHEQRCYLMAYSVKSNAKKL